MITKAKDPVPNTGAAPNIVAEVPLEHQVPPGYPTAAAPPDHTVVQVGDVMGIENSTVNEVIAQVQEAREAVEVEAVQGQDQDESVTLGQN